MYLTTNESHKLQKRRHTQQLLNAMDIFVRDYSCRCPIQVKQDLLDPLFYQLNEIEEVYNLRGYMVILAAGYPSLPEVPTMAFRDWITTVLCQELSIVKLFNYLSYIDSDLPYKFASGTTILLVNPHIAPTEVRGWLTCLADGTWKFVTFPNMATTTAAWLPVSAYGEIHTATDHMTLTQLAQSSNQIPPHLPKLTGYFR